METSTSTTMTSKDWKKVERVVMSRNDNNLGKSASEHNLPSALTIPQINNPSNAGKPEFKGVSVHFLRHGFLKEVEQEPGLTRDSKIYEIENLQDPTPGIIRRKGINVRCPMYDRKGAAYVHCLTGEDNVGDATHMLSYTWGYSIGDIVDTLESVCESDGLDPKRTYIWICCLCVNQHKIVADRNDGKDTPTEAFECVFKRRVVAIGRLICMLAPWEHPVYLTRIWCIFELYTAMTTNFCEISVAMPTSERARMFDKVIMEGGGIDALYDSLEKTKVENAEASVDSDRTKILAILKRGRNGHVCGYPKINESVNEFLRTWVRKCLQVLLQNGRSKYNKGDRTGVRYASLCINVTMVLNSNGEHGSALGAISKGSAVDEAVLGKEHPDTAASYNHIGSLFQNTGHYEEALAEYRKATAIYEVVKGKEHPDTAASHNNIGSVFQDMGQYEEALVEYRKALAINEVVLGKEHPSTRASYDGIGSVFQAMARDNENTNTTRRRDDGAGDNRSSLEKETNATDAPSLTISGEKAILDQH